MEQTDGYTEITEKNFEGWPPELIEESKRANANGRVGTKLLLESHVARIWVIELKPGESGRTHDSDGKLGDIFLARRGTEHR